jgi:hypothetical protein
MATGAARAVAGIVVVAGLLGAAGCGGDEAPPRGDPSGAPASAPASSPAGEAAPSAGPIAGCLDVDGPAVARPAAGATATAADQDRYEQLRLEALRLMIAAARLALPIGPCQQRIDRAAWTASQGDLPAAADIMEDVAAGLRGAVADAQP